MQVKLIPIYIEDQNLISVNTEDYDNYKIVNDIKFVKDDDNIMKEIKNNQEVYGERRIIKTNMKTKEFVINAISKYTERFKDDEELLDFIDKGSIEFSITKKGTYNIIFNGFFREDEIMYIKDFILEEYMYQVQEETYRKLSEKIRKHNYQILSEEIDDNDSIILTVNI